MSSPDALLAETPYEVEDDPMQDEEELDGDAVMQDRIDDSSEEEEDDEEEAKKVRDGFIVEEDEEEEDGDEEEERPRRRRKRRKKHHREEEGLEEDDLDLLAENTGGRFKRSRLTRLRHLDSGSPAAASSSKRRAVVESSEDDLDDEEDKGEAHDIQKIFDDDRRGDDDDEDIDDFIDYSDEEEAGAMNEEAREARREEKRQEIRRKRAQINPELVGIDANAWDEIHDVFGDGHEYDWALAGDDEAEFEEDQFKPDMRYQDVFEPSEIRKRMLTDDDDLIRQMDIPERMQLATSSLSSSVTLSLHAQMTEDDLMGAAMWVTMRLPKTKTRDFFAQDGSMAHLKGSLVMAVTYVLRQIFLENSEVPYIWANKRDYISHFDVHDIGSGRELLELKDLWLINTLGRKYRSLMERRRTLSTLYQRLQVTDAYYEGDIEPQIDSVEVVADATEWLSMKFKDKKQDAISEFRFHDDDDEADVDKKRKMPNRLSAYDVHKKSIASKLAEKYGILPHQVVLNFLSERHVHYIEDNDLEPVLCAEQYVDTDHSQNQTPEDLLHRARLILSTELGKDPLLRKNIRAVFREHARVTVEPTEAGVTKIDEGHAYFGFKYLRDKPIQQMCDTAQFLHILAAEARKLVTVSIFLPPDIKAMFSRRLMDAFSSDHFNDSAKAWNAERALVVEEAIDQHLIPLGAKWAREYLREEVEDILAARCGDVLRSRIDVASYLHQKVKYGEAACTVLAISWGKGDPHKDAVTLVFLDEAGRLREQTKVDNLFDADNVDEFVDLIRRRQPDVAVIGGFSISTLKLMHRVKQLLSDSGPPADSGWGIQKQAFDIPTVYVPDDVARIYQHSKRASEEFTALSSTAKYCVGLARYVQSPLNEFAALGGDVTAISFDEDNQHLLPKEKLLLSLEHALVDITNKVGIDINRAIADPYYQNLLPFVCGLGPRKAQMLVKKITATGGTLVNREQLLKSGLMTVSIFLNAASFLRIIQDSEPQKPSKNSNEENVLDPLDDTRIHPEDYDLSRKMATDALELDEEDIHGDHPSLVVTSIMNDPEKAYKLMELNLDEFAISLYAAQNDQKRHTLNVIREELLKPYSEKRKDFEPPQDWEVLTMLTGETKKTLTVGIIISAQVFRITREDVAVRLDSGIEGKISAACLTSDSTCNPFDHVKKGSVITCIVTKLFFNLEQDEIIVELSMKPEHMAEGDQIFRHVKPEQQYWDGDRHTKDQELLARKKRAETNRTRRVIKHPNFHNFNTAQAEAYLENQQRGDVVIRPSSKGSNHLAVTWKVDENLFQHIDVTELNADPNGQTIGDKLIVDQTHTYSDLDELIVNHVQAMARRVEELMAHEKFKQGSEDDLHLFLKNFLAANPAKSMYGFTLNRKRAGHFNLCFLANKNSTVQTWPVRVTPEAYYLFDAAAPGVPELCDAFKVRHLHESQNLLNASGGKTPFGAGMRTPARAGGATPGHMSVRQVGRTPNPYGGGQTPFAPNLAPNFLPPGPVPPNPQQIMYGYQTPSHHRPPFPNQPPLPPNMPLPPNLNPPPRQSWGQAGWS